MRKVYSMLVALGVAAASLTSCSKSTYSFNSAPAYLGSQPVAVAKARPVVVATPATEVAAPATNVVTPAPVAKAAPAKAAPVATAPAEVAPAAEAATVATAPAAKAAKPNLVQRLVLKKIAKQIAKIQDQKQATAGVDGTDKIQSLRKTAIILMVAGVVGLIAGIIIVAASAASVNGGGIGAGAILYILGGISLTVGTILLIVSFFKN